MPGKYKLFVLLLVLIAIIIAVILNDILPSGTIDNLNGWIFVYLLGTVLLIKCWTMIQATAATLSGKPAIWKITHLFKRLFHHLTTLALSVSIFYLLIVAFFLHPVLFARLRVDGEMRNHPGQLEREAHELAQLPATDWEAKGFDRNDPKGLPTSLARLAPQNVGLVRSRYFDTETTAPYALRVTLTTGFNHSGIYIPLRGDPATWDFIDKGGYDKVNKLSDNIYQYFRGN